MCVITHFVVRAPPTRERHFRKFLHHTFPRADFWTWERNKKKWRHLEKSNSTSSRLSSAKNRSIHWGSHFSRRDKSMPNCARCGGLKKAQPIPKVANGSQVWRKKLPYSVPNISELVFPTSASYRFLAYIYYVYAEFVLVCSNWSWVIKRAFQGLLVFYAFDFIGLKSWQASDLARVVLAATSQNEA